MTMDYQKIADGMDAMREVLRMMVAGLVQDGFTDEQARQLVVSVYTNKTEEEEDDD